MEKNVPNVSAGGRPGEHNGLGSDELTICGHLLPCLAPWKMHWKGEAKDGHPMPIVVMMCAERHFETMLSAFAWRVCALFGVLVLVSAEVMYRIVIIWIIIITLTILKPSYCTMSVPNCQQVHFRVSKILRQHFVLILVLCNKNRHSRAFKTILVKNRSVREKSWCVESALSRPKWAPFHYFLL